MRRLVLVAAAALACIFGGSSMTIRPAAAHVQLDLAAPDFRSAVRTSRHPAAHRSIEWRLGKESLNLLIHAPPDEQAATPDLPTRPRLYTFEPSVTIRDVLSSPFIRDLVEPARGEAVSCAMVDAIMKPHDASARLADLLELYARHFPNQPKTLRLQCRITPPTPQASQLVRTRLFELHEFEKPILRPNEIAAKNQLRRTMLKEDAPYPFTAVELLADNFAGLTAWAAAFLKNHWGTLHPFLNYTNSKTQTGRWHLNTGAVVSGDFREQLNAAANGEDDEPVRLALVADFGAGTMEADYTQNVMMNGVSNLTQPFDPHWTLHLGDIYYVGSSDEVKSNMLGIAPSGVKKGVTWPHGSIGSLAVPGNHEIYARRGEGFFDTFLPTLGIVDNSTVTGMSGQEASYAALENRYWRVIMLDTGFTTYAFNPAHDNDNNVQPDAIVDWLVNEVRIGDPTDTRGIIFVSHHQVVSAFDKISGATPRQIASLLPANRTVLWLYGHEHRLAFYAPQAVNASTGGNSFNVFPRCVGNGGYPTSISAIPTGARSAGLLAYDDRLYHLQTGFLPLPVAFNGFTRFILDKNAIHLAYTSLTTDPATGQLSNELETELVRETFVVDENGNLEQTDFTIVGDLTIIKNQ